MFCALEKALINLSLQSHGNENILFIMNGEFVFFDCVLVEIYVYMKVCKILMKYIWKYERMYIPAMRAPQYLGFNYKI